MLQPPEITQFISGQPLSLDLAGQARFAAVRAAIGGISSPDYSARTRKIYDAAVSAKNSQQGRGKDSQDYLGRALTALTEARSAAERSSNVSDALQMLDSLGVSLPTTLAERVESVRNLIVEKRTSLQAIEAARLRSVALMPEFKFFNSDVGQGEIKTAQLAVENATQAAKLADQSLGVALQLDA